MIKSPSNGNIRLNSPKAWLLAARPKTLTGASVPVIIGTALALADLGSDNFLVLPAVLCFLFAFIMQIAANFINDYFDYIHGNDGADRLGPRRACAMGWVTAGAMKRAIGIAIVAACLCGLPLVLYGGMEMILVGMLCVMFCFLYTTRFSYMGLGDVLVLVFFGIVPVTMTYYVQIRSVTFEAFMLSVACGLVVDTLLVVNNYRDCENDRRAGKNTLITRIGIRAGGYFYLALGIAAVGAYPCGCPIDNDMHITYCLPLVYIALHLITYTRMVRIRRGRQLNKILGETSRNIFIFGLLTAAGLLI